MDELSYNEKMDAALKDDKIIGFTRDKVWVPLKNPVAFFGSALGMLTAIPFALDAFKVYNLLHHPQPFTTGWSTPLDLVVFAAIWLISLIVFVSSVTQAEHLAVVGVPETEKKPTESEVKEMIENSLRDGRFANVKDSSASGASMGYMSEHIARLIAETENQRKTLEQSEANEQAAIDGTALFDGGESVTSPTKKHKRRGKHSVDG